MKKNIGRMMILVGIVLIAFIVFQGIMMDKQISQYVFLNKEQLGLLVGVSLGLIFAPLKSDMLR